MGNSLIVIPTYNEIENISDIIAAVLEQNEVFDILIVDDNSPDGTAERVQELQQETNRIHLLQREGKLGLGTAYIAGFNYGLDNGYDFIFEMDADFSHPPKVLNDLLKACQERGDVAVGSRYVKGGGVKDWPKNRLWLSQGAGIYTRTILGMPVMDPTAGFKCYRREVLEAISFDKIKSIGYAFQIEMKYAAYKKGYNIVEVPIIFADREKGTSKMNMGIVREAILGVVSMRLKAIRGYYS